MKVKRLIELNDEGIFVTSDTLTNGKRLVKYWKEHYKRAPVIEVKKECKTKQVKQKLSKSQKKAGPNQTELS